VIRSQRVGGCIEPDEVPQASIHGHKVTGTRKQGRDGIAKHRIFFTIIELHTPFSMSCNHKSIFVRVLCCATVLADLSSLHRNHSGYINEKELVVQGYLSRSETHS
jgi:hypothetical protein